MKELIEKWEKQYNDHVAESRSMDDINAHKKVCLCGQRLKQRVLLRAILDDLNSLNTPNEMPKEPLSDLINYWEMIKEDNGADHKVSVGILISVLKQISPNEQIDKEKVIDWFYEHSHGIEEARIFDINDFKDFLNSGESK